MSNYIVTNIRLPEEDYLKLKEEAAKKRTSLSAVIRKKVGSKKKISREKWLKELLTLDTSWFDYKEFKKNRAQMEKRFRKYNW